MTPAPQHLLALLPSDNSALGDKSYTYTINKPVYLPATQALLPVKKNEAASSFGLADHAQSTLGNTALLSKGSEGWLLPQGRQFGSQG